MCLGDLVESWFWTNGFTAVPEVRTQGIPHIKSPQYGGRGIICSEVCTKNRIGFALSAFFLCKETLRLKTFCFDLFCFVTNLSSDSIPVSDEKERLMLLSLYQLKAAVKH